MSVRLYDTTLRDGAQSEYISFSVEDKLKIAEKLDELGIHYIEGGWPGSNPKDEEFFERVRELELTTSRVVAFGSTRRAGVRAERDSNLQALLDTGTECVTIFGKSWDLHVREALRVTLEDNLAMITESVEYLKEHGREVFYDAEHFFDAYKSNPEYALATLRAAEDAKVDCIVLCDTNGGTLPFETMEIMKELKRRIRAPLGIHAHNDADTAVANSVIAVRMGAVQVHGTINGYGERCGNANLCSIIPNIKLKLGIDCVTDEQLRKLTEISRFVSEIANMPHQHNMPYVGSSAFAHKAGVHVDAVNKTPRTYEHIDPEKVGNTRRFLVSELSGRTGICIKAREFGIPLEKNSEQVTAILRKLKEMEMQGYQFEGAEASFEILIKQVLGMTKEFFRLEGFRVLVTSEGGRIRSEATVKLRVRDRYEHTAADGNGPVNALDNALRKALEKFYPELREVHLTDYKVRVLDTHEGTGAKVRVLIESSDGRRSWSTVGVSENIIEASWVALEQGLVYKLMKEQESGS